MFGIAFYISFCDVKPWHHLRCALDAMPNGLLWRICSVCNVWTGCHPWYPNMQALTDVNVEPEWYCDPCFRLSFVVKGVKDMQRLVLPGARPRPQHASARLFRNIFSNEVLAFMIIDFVEDRG